MKIRITDFCKFSMAIAVLGACTGAVAAGAQNPRSGVNTVAGSHTPGTTSDSRRGNAVTSVDESGSRAAVRRTGATVARGASSSNVIKVASGRTVAPARVATGTTGARGGNTPARAAAGGNVVRSATNVMGGATVARGAVNGVSHASRARATAVYDDVSKMGSGYATCRDAYATCMDQLCAKANDTYRRCFCSSRFADFRDTESALDQAKTLLMSFEDNSLNAVDKTAAEVNAMYSATAGEAAIKKDTSAAQKTLSEISDLLSGKKKASTATKNSTSLGMLSLDFSASVDDIWGDASDGGGIFGSDSGTDLSQLEGLELYNKANAQCLKIIGDSCSEKAVLNMAKSSYSILISQDCNAYEKKINAQRESIKQTARQAEKVLRDARLEEYRAHNSADVNECLGKVRSAMLQDTACGAGYQRCLDSTGAYVNQSTGEPIYSPRLFQLTDVIKLDGVSTDVLGQNPTFNTFLDSKKMFATSALDTCRDMSDMVWSEFKRAALIEIAQAQDELIESVKSSCVTTMKQCYDTQSAALKSFDDTTAQAAGAIAAYASKAMCKDKVIACAALYGDGNQTCNFDNDGKLTGDNSKCGLSALLAYVDTVDTVRVAEGCSGAIDNYVKDLCTPDSKDAKFPWNCRLLELGNPSGDTTSGTSIADRIRKFALDNCSDPTKTKSYADNDSVPAQTKRQVEKSIRDIQEQLDYQMMDVCEGLDGVWLDADNEDGTLLAAFYSTVYGKKTDNTTWGRCVENSTMVQCLQYNDPQSETKVATYDKAKDECTFSQSWFEQQCTFLGHGYYENGICYVAK